MASGAVSELVIFIAALAAAGGVAAALTVATGHYIAGLRDRSASLEEEMGTRVAIVNDPAATPTAPLKLYVKNVGSQDLDIPSFVVLVDGTATTDWTWTVGAGTPDTLNPGEMATLSVAGLALGAGDHRAVVVTGPGTQATLEFQV